MAAPNWDTLTILGVGLLGGSIGLAARKYGVARRVIGWGRRPATLEAARRLHAIDEAVSDLAEAVREAQLVVVCTPVETVAEMVLQSLRHMRPDAFITDVGSTKLGIVDEVTAGYREATAGAELTRFIPSHPLAGGERSGVEHARGELFQGKTVIVTPTGFDSPAGRAAITEFWQALGARVVEQSPDAHDRTVAAISHLPHLVASLTAALTPDEALPFVASGWLDTTRVAAGDAELWRQIFAENRRHVGEALDEFIRVSTECRDALRQGDYQELTRWLVEGKRKREKAMIWEIDIHPLPGQPDFLGRAVASAAADFGLANSFQVRAAAGFLLEGTLDGATVGRIASELLADTVVERPVFGMAGDPSLAAPPAELSATGELPQLIQVMLKPGVMDPVAQSAQKAIADFDVSVDAVRTIRKYWIQGLSVERTKWLAQKILSNDSIEQVVIGPLHLDRLHLGAPYQLQVARVPLRQLDDEGLKQLSKTGQLYLTLVEMQTIQKHFVELGRDPTDIELESVAQTWSEHCSHKTLAGRIAYRDEKGERSFKNMLKETIFAATVEIRRRLGADDWCVSVFEDNAGVVRFDDEFNVVFKVETHNHPSAIEPYGGANTGVGGVIRDPLGTGLGAKPICNTDVFCFAPPDTPTETLPPGVLHPRRVMKGVVSGVRDYGNRMGIPTVNGAIYFDPRYLGNPLVYCGNVGLIPRDKTRKESKAGDHIVVLGGRTGRDGIHGATFSSAELTSESESISGGAVQIGNAITEKMVLDVLLAARDRGLFNAVTDCGAGGLSSAVGEMGAETGAEVWLDKAPLKYEGLSYTEIWISEAQERMVLSVAPEQWSEFEALCRSEGVEATIIGKFVPTGRLKLLYDGQEVGDLPMSFLHDGRPPVVRDAVYEPKPSRPLTDAAGRLALAVGTTHDPNQTLCAILGSLNVASKEWVIRQYDHEVQGGSVVKPLVGAANDGPSDAAVVRPVLNSRRALVISCGMNPRFGDLDPYHMAASAIDEAVRNCVAVGADPTRIAILDNFCWGYTDRPETLGSLVRAALACYDLAVQLGTPFISGKDSLNNEFSYEADGRKQTISIPPSLLISALGQVADAEQCVTMDLKRAGDKLFQVGVTRLELGGSHFSLVHGLTGGEAPRVDPALARRTFERLHSAIRQGTVRACHDLSEGGLAVAAAEMAFAGACGAELDLARSPHDLAGATGATRATALLFAESNTRFLCEVPADKAAEFSRLLGDVPHAEIGAVTDSGRLVLRDGSATVVDRPLSELKEAWQAPLRW